MTEKQNILDRIARLGEARAISEQSIELERKHFNRAVREASELATHQEIADALSQTYPISRQRVSQIVNEE